VAPDFVITSAHCLRAFDSIEVNRYDFSDGTETIETFMVFENIVHPRYNYETDRFDVMLIQLDGAVSLVEPIRVNQDADFPDFTTMLTVIGWGLTESGYPDKLQEVEMAYIPNPRCKNIPDEEGLMLGDWVTSDMLCAGDEGKDACYGDSGSPLIARRGQEGAQEDVLVGVVSWGLECAGPHPGIYSRVSRTFTWIQRTICRNSDWPPDYMNCNTFAPSETPTNMSRVEPSAVPSMQPTWNPTTHASGVEGEIRTDTPSGKASEPDPNAIVAEDPSAPPGAPVSEGLRLFTWTALSLALVPHFLIWLC
jgi:hypothetical protein